MNERRWIEIAKPHLRRMKRKRTIRQYQPQWSSEPATHGGGTQKQMPPDTSREWVPANRKWHNAFGKDEVQKAIRQWQPQWSSEPATYGGGMEKQMPPDTSREWVPVNRKRQNAFAEDEAINAIRQ
jgi:hypothetical protein